MENDSQFKELQRRVEQLERDAKHTKTYGSQIRVDLDSVSRDSFNREFTPKFIADLQEQIYNAAWDNYFYYYTPFESFDGWNVFLGAPTVGTAGLTLSATADQTAAAKYPGVGSPFSFDFESRFRTALALDSGTTPDGLTLGLSIGGNVSSVVTNNYGFLVEGNVIYGATGNGTNTSRVRLGTLDATQGNGLEFFPRIVEARFFPQSKVDFYMSEVGGETLRLLGTLRTTLPSGTITSGGGGWVSLHIKAASGTKTAYVNFVEYIQRRTGTINV
jgi:hypothetical protein